RHLCHRGGRSESAKWRDRPVLAGARRLLRHRRLHRRHSGGRCRLALLAGYPSRRAAGGSGGPWPGHSGPAVEWALPGDRHAGLRLAGHGGADQRHWAGGRTGITLNPPQIGSSSLTDRSFFWIVLGLLLAGGAVARNLRRGATGRAFVALRESEPAAQASGIDLARYRVTAFALSALYAGIAGALYAHWAGYISADNFDLPLSISFVAMIVVGDR